MPQLQITLGLIHLKWNKEVHNLPIFAVIGLNLRVTCDLTLIMTSALVVETSVTTTGNSPQEYTYSDDHTTLSLPIFVAKFVRSSSTSQYHKSAMKSFNI